MSTVYELATLDVKLWAAADILPRLKDYIEAGRGRGSLIGCWETDIGPQQRVLMLRAFPSLSELEAEREHLLLSDDPFEAGRWLKQMSLETYRPFAFMPPIAPGAHGPAYEFRYYELEIGGLPRTLSSWEQTLPGRTPISPVFAAMYALDGLPRILHIIAYSTLDVRRRLRGQLYHEKRWPPPNAPEQVRVGRAEIAYPSTISPAQ